MEKCGVPVFNGGVWWGEMWCSSIQWWSVVGRNAVFQYSMVECGRDKCGVPVFNGGVWQG